MRRDAGMREWVEAGLQDLQKISKISHQRASLLLKIMSIPVIGWLATVVMFALFLGSLVRKRIFLKQTECQLRTVSAVIREHNIEVVDLM